MLDKDEIIDNKHLKSSEELFRKRYPEEYKDLIGKVPSDLSWIEKLYWYVYDLKTHPVCMTCGKPVKFFNFTKGYRRFCSSGCASKNDSVKDAKKITTKKHYGVENPSQNPDIQNKKIQSSLEKYGVSNPSQSEYIKEKSRKTNLKRYGVEHASQSESVKEKTKHTNLERYGTEYYTQTDRFKEQTKKTNLERYGVENISQSDSVKEKTKQTNLERYGAEYYTQTKEFKEKSRKTNLKRYGVENAIQSEPVREKSRKTNLKRYGVENAIQSEHVREKTRQTNLERYGVENPFRSDQIKEKIRQVNLEKYGDEVAARNDQVRQKLSESLKRTWQNKTPEDIERIRYRASKRYNIEGVIDRHIENDVLTYTCSCPHKDCHNCENKTFEIPSDIFSNRRYQGIELCTKLFPVQYDKITSTSLETTIRNILDSSYISYITNDRSVLGGKELDIYISDYKLAIECNGIYWHSMKGPSYHFNKWKICKDKGIQLLTLWEDQIKHRHNIVEGLVRSKLGIYDHRIGARKCALKEVPSKESNKFLKENHLQGSTNGSVRLGLYYNDELVSIMVFGHKRRALGNKEDNKETYELYRYCNKIGWQVVGGASRLFNHFLDSHPGCMIESFSSNDISVGDLYRKLGFELIDIQKGSYWYIDKYMNRHHRYSYRKDVLVRNGADPLKTEFEITAEMGLMRIYDSGQQKWIYK